MRYSGNKTQVRQPFSQIKETNLESHPQILQIAQIPQIPLSESS